MKKSIVRIISLLLAIAAIVACSSCQPEEPIYDNALHVTVTNEEIVYSQSFLEDAEERFATVANFYSLKSALPNITFVVIRILLYIFSHFS